VPNSVNDSAVEVSRERDVIEEDQDLRKVKGKNKKAMDVRHKWLSRKILSRKEGQQL
jgi:hypothetical protein